MYSSLTKQPSNRQFIRFGIIDALHVQDVIQLHPVHGGHIVGYTRHYLVLEVRKSMGKV
jgi:hypothetical protein